MASAKATSLKMQEDRKAMPGHRSSATLMKHERNEYKESHPGAQLLIDRLGMPEPRAKLVARLIWGEGSV